MSKSESKPEIVIACASLTEALDTASSLQAKLAVEAWLVPNTFNLRVSLDHVDNQIIKHLKQVQLDTGTVVTPASEPVWLDYEVDLETEALAQLAVFRAKFANEWNAANGDAIAEKSAYLRVLRRKQELRFKLLRDRVALDATPESLIYGPSAANFPCECIPKPDGKARVVTSVIHLSHPTSPEDLYLRHQRIICDRIIRYHIPGLDDPEWIRQNEPRSQMDARAWRELLRDRAQATLTQ